MPQKLLNFLFLGVISSVFVSCSDLAEKTNSPLRVFAAVSLSSVTPAVAASFQTEFEGAEIEFNFAASSILAKQIARGADADIYLSANPEWMQFLNEKKKIKRDTQVNFLKNELVLVTPRKSPKHLTGLEDLLGPDIFRIALADWSHVPAGIYAKAVFENAGIWHGIQNKCIPALDVRAALTYVERGDADCGLVYATDAAISKNVIIALRLPQELQPDIQYSGAAIQHSGHPLSAVFLTFLQSSRAKEIFRKNGFIIPQMEPDN